MKTIQTPIAEISFDEPEQILHIKVLEDATMNLKNAQIHYEKINKLLGGKKYFALVDASNYFTMEQDAWRYASSKEVVSNRMAIAHYNASFANKLTTNFFKSMYQTAVPLQIFDSKEEAEKWLKSMKATS